MPTTILDIHGILVELESNCAQFHEWLSFDFRCFLSSGASRPADVAVEVTLGAIPRDKLPPLVESMHGLQYVCFDSGNIRYVDYFGKAFAIHNYATERVQLFSEDAEFCYEKLYLLIQSRVGELLDRRGIHRVHALGLSTPHGAAIFLIPMKGGKSTLALRALNNPAVRLISDDTPLVRWDGTILPFPIRLGVMPGEVPSGVPAQAVRSFQRELFGPKQLVDASSFHDRIERAGQPGKFVICGKWTLASEPSIHRISRLRGLRALVRDCVIGLGLPQVVEFFLRTPSKDVLPKGLIALRRLRAVTNLVRRCDVYEMHFCRDQEKNMALLLERLLSQPESKTQ